jgi:hypothetical protein
MESPMPLPDSNRYTNPTSGRHHHAWIVLLGQIAGILCAIGAGFGVAIGLLAPQDGVLSGVVIPIVAGSVIAATLAIAWHVVLLAGARVHTVCGIIGTAAAGALLLLVAAGASSWPVATVLVGGPAQRHHLAESVKAEERGFNAVLANIQAETPMVENTAAAANSMRALAGIETEGGLSKKSGPGTRVKILNAAADSFDHLADTMRALLEHAHELQERGRGLLVRLQAAITGDPAVFAQRAADLQGVTAELDTIYLTPLVAGAGIAKVEINWDDPAVHQIKTGFDLVTTKLQAAAKAIADARQPVELPLFEPMTAREATLAYAGHVLGGWVSAAALDMIPGIFLLLVMMTPHDHALFEQVRRRDADDSDRTGNGSRPTTNGYAHSDRVRRDGLLRTAQPDGVVVSLTADPAPPWRRPGHADLAT